MSVQVRGSVDQVSRFGIAGWAQNMAEPGRRVIVGISLGNELLGAAVCQEFRDDLFAAGIGDGRHAFTHSFSTPIAEEHLAHLQVTFASQTLPRSEPLQVFRRRGFILPPRLSDPDFQDPDWQAQDFSQHEEQAHILRYWEERPNVPRYCIDLGAYDGVTGSNSRALLLRGWGGVLVEPDPRTFARLAVLYADRPDVISVRCAISDQPGSSLMHFVTGEAETQTEDAWRFAQLNTLQADIADRVRSELGIGYVRHSVAVATLAELLEWVRAPKDIGFLSIDCEGMDLKIIRSIDFTRCRPWLLAVECDDELRRGIASTLSPVGYHVYAATRSNTLFCRGET